MMFALLIQIRSRRRLLADVSLVLHDCSGQA